MPQQTLSIIGLGLIGGSVGLAVKKHLSLVQIIGYDRDAETTRLAFQRGAIDRPIDSLDEALSTDRILICVPPSAAETVLAAIAKAARPGTLVSDVLSTKRSIHRSAETLSPTVDFVGSHPIAGSEKVGIQHADDRLLAGALCAISSGRSVNDRSLTSWIDFWTSLGMRTVQMSPDEHDRQFAAVSHLPHAVAAALMSVTASASLDLAGKGFADTTRIAAGNPELWRDILLDNADNVRDGLRSLGDELRRLADQLDDPAKLLNYLKLAAERRRSLGSGPKQ